MKSLSIAILLFLLLLKQETGIAQINLVPNGSFEIYDTCPDLDGQITRAASWFQPYNSWGGSDYFNSCSIDTGSNVPNNYFGIQQANSGIAYAGLTTGYFNGNNYREYIEVELIDSLQVGWKYAFEMYVSFCDYGKRACDGIGAYFSNSIVTYNNPPWGLLNYTTQVNNSLGIITDTSNWVLIVDTFVAQGGEKFMTIGNFKSDGNTNWITFNPTAPHIFSNYYIDDVSVILCDSTTGIATLTAEDVVLSPNPASERIKIGLAFACQQEARIKMYSSIGALLLESDFREELDVSLMAKGIYFLSVETLKGRVVKKVIVD